MPHCDVRVRWKVASDLRFRAAISEPKTPSFCGISGDLAPSTRKSLAIAIVRFWCAKKSTFSLHFLDIPGGARAIGQRAKSKKNTAKAGNGFSRKGGEYGFGEYGFFAA